MIGLFILLNELILEDIRGFLAIMDEMMEPMQDLLLTKLAYVGGIDEEAGFKLDSYRTLRGN